MSSSRVFILPFLIFNFEVKFGNVQSPSNMNSTGVLNIQKPMESGVVGEHGKPFVHEVRPTDMKWPKNCDIFSFACGIVFFFWQKRFDQNPIYFRYASGWIGNTEKGSAETLLSHSMEYGRLAFVRTRTGGAHSLFIRSLKVYFACILVSKVISFLLF